MSLRAVTLGLSAAQFPAVKHFYTAVIGAQALKCPSTELRFGFASPQSAELHFSVAGKAAGPGKEDSYWKIGLVMPDVRRAAARLKALGVEVSEPRQFEEIGFLAHLTDPAGYTIELLQHTFEKNFKPVAEDASSPLGQAAWMGQLTLRVSDAAAAVAFYRDRLGMAYLSKQEVMGGVFCLHFLAQTTESGPAAGLEAVGNREWLWQRPYTTLELVAYRDPRAFAPDPECFQSMSIVADKVFLGAGGIHDPDGHRILTCS